MPFLSPAITIYFLVIMTTIFYLDIKKSIFAGFIAALQYFLVIYYFLPSLDPVKQFIPLYKINFYIKMDLLLHQLTKKVHGLSRGVY